jgi:midasin (ATPase involved in ribosome maturation)
MSAEPNAHVLTCLHALQLLRSLSITPPSVDATVPGFVRVGSVYMSKGTCHTQPSTPVITHSPRVLSSLEALAAACQSGRAVLLQGPVASGKTSLPRELARLAQRKLHILSLSTDTGDMARAD